MRTNFDDDAAWDAFLSKLQDGEREFTSESDAGSSTNSPAQNVQAGGDEDQDMDEDSDSGSGDGQPSGSLPIFAILSEPRDALNGISNLAALRYLNDLTVRRAPTPPPGTTRAKPHRLIDQDGWQEVYTGKPLWIYDTRSNSDQCVRVVGQTSADGTYGTATCVSSLFFILQIGFACASSSLRHN